ncbi:RNA-binding domain-containing protein [Panus rudis PR-1116 ss-1]|nr:RNA-binding domain-containing protein [Panus rudis PR-1116 ss-1]
MAPKKAQKMSLNEFLGDTALGSWADEMDALPTAPAARADDDRSRPGDRRRDDFLSSRPDRGGPPREDLPLPTEPPYTAFIGNLSFDISDVDIEDFFGASKIKSIKIIKDRDDKPKGFGYVEFTDLDALKEALAKTNLPLAGRVVRISVAEPPKERSGFGAAHDDEKFAGNWRRDGPLPDLPSREGPRRRFDGPPSREPLPPAVSDNASDWRSSRAPISRAPPPDEGGPSLRGRGSGFRAQDGGPQGPADTEEVWVRGAKFQPSGPPENRGSRFGPPRDRSDLPPRERETASPPDEGDWRRPRAISRNSTSPNNSTPPTPQLGRRKLELLPRSSGSSAVPSPLSSPNPSGTSSSRSNPFGAAKPVDVSAREAAVMEKLEKDRELTKERVAQHSMSRTSSRTGSQRGERTSHPASPSSPKPDSPRLHNAPIANVRPSFSFANAAAGKKDSSDVPAESNDGPSNADNVGKLADKVAESSIEDTKTA